MWRRTEHDGLTLLSVGHSTHQLERFLELLTLHRVQALADVRSFPSSRRYPQFDRSCLQAALEGAAIEYHWLPGLGGRRHRTRNDSPHTGGWHHPAFRAYAEHMESAEFSAALERLITIAVKRTVAFMCAEGLWWKCHRRLISDRLVSLGYNVEHIMPDGRLAAHRLAPFARVENGALLYDKPEKC